MKKIKAFTILEAALAILLVGIFSSIIIPYWQFIEQKKNQEITVIKANYIRKAIQGYVARYGFLPSAAESDGVEKFMKTKGFIPYKTLGISKNYLKDGFNKPFVYIVSYGLLLDKYKSLKREIVPIQLPYHISQDQCAAHFCRIYKYDKIQENESFEMALSKIAEASDHEKTELKKLNIQNLDTINEKELIKIYKVKKDQEISLVNFENMKIPHVFFHPHICNIISEHRNTHERVLSKYYNYTNSIAFVLVSKTSTLKLFNKNIGYVLYKEGELLKKHFISGNCLIFWQSRFNLAAQINVFCMLLPMDQSKKLEFMTVYYSSNLKV